MKHKMRVIVFHLSNQICHCTLVVERYIQFLQLIDVIENKKHWQKWNVIVVNITKNCDNRTNRLENQTVMGLQKTSPSLFCPKRYKTVKIISAFIPFSPVLLAIVGIFNLNTKLCPMSLLPSLERSLKHNTSTSSLSLNLKDHIKW